MLCLAGTLTVMIVAARIPIEPGWAPVGWYVLNRSESIPVEVVERRAEGTISHEGAPVTRFDEGDVTAPQDDDLEPESEPEQDEESSVESARPLERLRGRRVFDSAQSMPSIVGGMGAYYIHIEYPEEAIRAGIQGRLVLSFIVETDGRTSDVEVIKGLHPACDSAAVRALRHTRFVPGQQNGKSVPVRMHLPVRFKIVPSGEASG